MVADADWKNELELVEIDGLVIDDESSESLAECRETSFSWCANRGMCLFNEAGCCVAATDSDTAIVVVVCACMRKCRCKRLIQSTRTGGAKAGMK